MYSYDLHKLGFSSNEHILSRYPNGTHRMAEAGTLVSIVRRVYFRKRSIVAVTKETFSGHGYVTREQIRGSEWNRAVSIRLAEWVIRAAEPISDVAQGEESERHLLVILAGIGACTYRRDVTDG